MFKKLIEKWNKTKEVSNEAVGMMAMAAMCDDRRYLEVVEKFGAANDAYLDNLRALTEEVLYLRQEVNKMKYFKGA